MKYLLCVALCLIIAACDNTCPFPRPAAHVAKPIYSFSRDPLCPDASKLAAQISQSIRTEPKYWRTDGFRLYRDFGPYMWVANGADMVSWGSDDGSASNPIKIPVVDGECIMTAFSWLQDYKVRNGE